MENNLFYSKEVIQKEIRLFNEALKHWRYKFAKFRYDPEMIKNLQECHGKEVYELALDFKIRELINICKPIHDIIEREPITLSVPEETCPACAKSDEEVNHPIGMIFVGWGRGWETCPRCSGTTLVKK